MSVQSRLKRIAAVTSLSLLGLSAAFNNASAVTEVNPAPSETLSSSAQTATPSLEAQIEAIFVKISVEFQKNQGVIGKSAANNPIIQQQIDDLTAILGRSHMISPEQRDKEILPYFIPSLALAIEAGRLDLAQAFIDTGLSVRDKLGGGETRPMDHAIALFLRQERSNLTRLNAAIDIIKMLLDKGAQLEDAAVTIQVSKGALQSFADLGRNTAMLNALHQAGLVNDDDYEIAMNGAPELKNIIRNMDTLNRQTLEQYGIETSLYTDAPPGGPEPYKVVKDDTLWSLAKRFQRAMGADSHHEALQQLAAINNITLDAATGDAHRLLQIDETLLIPVTIGIEVVAVTPLKDTTLRELAENIKGNFHDQSLTTEAIAAEIAIMNRLDISRIDDKTLLPKGQALYIAYLRDSHNQLPSMTPPAHYQGDREVDLMVIEPASDHGKNTYRVATGTGYSINPDVDLGNFHFWSELLLDYPSKKMSDMLRMLLSSQDSPLNDRVIFSHSMAQTLPEETQDIVRNAQAANSTPYENVRQSLDRLNKARPIIFTASGNFWMTDGRYIQSSQLMHSPRTVQIGAAGYFPKNIYGQMDRIIAPYSSHGADICAPLPKFMRTQLEGTSFSTPLTAALYRQMSEWYGDRLSFEEIMAAALMTADQDILDYAYFDTMDKHPLVQPDKYDTQQAAFRTNGAGLPNHDRCGAGILNLAEWQKALDNLVALKQDPAITAEKDEGFTVSVNAGDPTTIYYDHKGEAYKYVYTLHIPADMTLGKLSFLLPQEEGKHSEIVVRTPGGFEKHMSKSLSNVVSTFAFAYEDVQKGQTIEIRTAEPLGSTAGIILRGHLPGNAIAALRDQLHQAGKLPAPNQDMAGATITGPSAPVTLFTAPPVPEDKAAPDDPKPEEYFETPPMPILPVKPKQPAAPQPSL